jgi:hypothetical protein
MKGLVFFCGLLIITVQLRAQLPTYNWARNPDPSGGGGKVQNVATDNSLNSFLAGTFGYSLTFGSDILTESNGAAAFIAKYDLSGAVQWARCATGDISYGNAVAADPAGNVYFGGYFYTTIHFGAYTLTSSGGADIFLVKYDSNGNVVWARQAGGTSNDQLNSIATDESGNVYFTGWSGSATATFDVLTLNNSGTANAFLVKYSSAGGGLWATRVVGSNSKGQHVIVDATGNVYFSGMYTAGSYTFGSDVLTNSGNTDSFLAKYRSSNGSELWVRKIGASKEEYIGGITLNSSGDVFITGYFSSSSVTVGTFTITQGGNFNSFVARYSSGGTVLWAVASTNSNTVTSGDIITADCQGCIGNSPLCDNVYVSGTLNTSTTMYFGSVGFAPQAGADNSWFAVFSSSGTPLAGRVIPFGGVDQNALSIDINRHIYLGGDYSCGSAAVLGSDTLSCADGSNNPFTSQLEVTGCTSTLPVLLTSFTAEMKDEMCQLHWATSSEINNDHFTVERSTDGREFNTLMTVDSKALNGNSTVNLSYGAIDDKPFGGVSYYRLKQTDLNGKNNYSDIVAVKNSAGTSLSVYPNPSHSDFIIKLNTEMENSTNSTTEWVEIINSIGEKVYSDKLSDRSIHLNKTGIYFVKVSDGNNVNIEKLTIQ